MAWRCIAIALAVAGTFVQLLHVSVNFSYVWFYEHYETFRPKNGFLFIPEASPLAAFYRALMAGDNRVDMWLVNVYRAFGMSRLLIVATPLVVGFVFSAWRLTHALRRVAACDSQPSTSVDAREDLLPI